MAEKLAAFKHSCLKWNQDLKLFSVVKSTGNHWHTIGFPVNGQMYALPEETLFLVDLSQAVFSLEDGQSFSNDIEDLLDFLINTTELSYEQISTYLALKKLGYILFRPTNPYLKNIPGIDPSALYAVFKPNSSFQKKDPSGFLGCIYGRDADAEFLQSGISEGLTSVYDSGNQIFLKLTDQTSRLYLRGHSRDSPSRATLMKRQAHTLVDEESLEEEGTPGNHGDWHPQSNSEEHEQAGQQCHVTVQRQRAQLTPKQITRILKNRQAAQNSRERKKAYLSELESTNDSLKKENSTLRVRIQGLEEEKVSLSSDINQLKAEFDQLRALVLARARGSSSAYLVDERMRTEGSPTTAPLPSATYDAGAALRPTDTPAMSVPASISSPSIKTFDHTLLGNRLRTTMQLSARTRYARAARHHALLRRPLPRSLSQQRSQQLVDSVAPLTRRLLSARLMKERFGASAAKTYRAQTPLKSSPGYNLRTILSSTWSSPRPRRMSLTDLVNILITKYQRK